MELIKFVPESLFILVVTLWIMGTMFKQASIVKDAYIPFLLSAVGIIFTVCLQGFNTNSVMQGIICAAISTYGNNLIKQTKEIIEDIK